MKPPHEGIQSIASTGQYPEPFAPFINGDEKLLAFSIAHDD